MSAKDEEMKIRVPAAMKAAFRQIADKRTTSEAAIAREAFIEYLERRGLQPRREEPPPYKVSSERKEELAAEALALLAKGKKSRKTPKAPKTHPK